MTDFISHKTWCHSKSCSGECSGAGSWRDREEFDSLKDENEYLRSQLADTQKDKEAIQGLFEAATEANLQARDQLRSQSAQLVKMRKALRDIQLYLNGQHGRNDNVSTVINVKINEALAARENK